MEERFPEDYEFRDPIEPRLPVHAAPLPVPPKRQHFLDGLRGLAALLVYFFHHIGWHYGPDNDIFKGYGVDGPRLIAQLPFIRVFFSGGHAAVAIFFALSGYVLSIGPLRLIRDGYLVKCYTGLNAAVIKRPFRLFVPTAGVSICFAIAMHLPFGLAPKMPFPQALPTLKEELGRWVTEFTWLINPFVPHRTQGHWFLYDPPAYTMAMELTGSLFIFGLLAVSASLPTRLRLLFFICTWLICMFTYRWVLTGFVGGVILAFNELEGFDQPMFKGMRASIKDNIHFAIFVVGWYLISGPGTHDHPEHLLQAHGWKFLGRLIPTVYKSQEYFRFWDNIGAPLVLYSVLRISWLQTFFSTKVLQHLGRISLSLYLVHGPLMYSICDRIYRFFGRIFQKELVTWFDNRIPIPDIGIRGLSTRWIICQALILPLNLAFAEAGTKLFDLPSITIGKWVIQRLKLAA